MSKEGTTIRQMSAGNVRIARNIKVNTEQQWTSRNPTTQPTTTYWYCLVSTQPKPSKQKCYH